MLVDMEISFTSILFKTFWKHSTYPIIINFFTVLLCTFQAIYKGMFMLPFCHIFDVKLTCPFLSIVSNLRFVILWKCSFEMSLLIWHNACFPLFPLSCNVVIWQCSFWFIRCNTLWITWCIILHWFIYLCWCPCRIAIYDSKILSRCPISFCNNVSS